MNDKEKSVESELEPETLDEGVEAQEQKDESANDETLSVVEEEIDFGQFEDDSREELIEKLVSATSQVNDMRDGFIRARADVENIQRRSQNEMVSARKFAVEGFARELLSVVDSLEQASKVEMDENSSDAVAKMKEGLELTLKQFETVMEKFGVVSLQAEAGVKFDPEIHQAISMIDSNDIESGHIVDVMQKGFNLKDRLLRPAMVVIAN